MVIKILLDKYIITAGEDNKLMVWDLQEIDSLESDEDFNIFVNPLRVIKIGDNLS